MAAGLVRAVQFSPEQVDQWVFNRWGGSAATRDRLSADLALRIDDLDRACAITPIQKKKLMLAGQGDIKRYFDRVDDLKQKYTGDGSGKSANANTIWQDMQPLQIELLGGLFGADSIFAKTIRSTLDADQARHYQELLQERAAERATATIEWFVVHIDKALGLSELQRRRLVELLVSEAPPPQRFGQADFWYLMYQMTRLPEARIKAILDEPQWRLLSRQFMQARGMEPWLKSNGLIAQGTQPSVPARRCGPRCGCETWSSPRPTRRGRSTRRRIDRQSKTQMKNRCETKRMRRTQVCRLRQLVFLALGAWALMPCAGRAQQAGGDRQLVRRPENDLFDLQIEDAIDQLTRVRANAIADDLSRGQYSLTNAEAFRARLEGRLKIRIDHVDRACKLAPEQRAKLNVAGRGDMKRVFARMEELDGLLTTPALEVAQAEKALARTRPETS